MKLETNLLSKRDYSIQALQWGTKVLAARLEYRNPLSLEQICAHVELLPKYIAYGHLPGKRNPMAAKKKGRRRPTNKLG